MYVSISVLHRIHFDSFPLPVNQSVPNVHQTRMERLFSVFSACDCGIPPVPMFRSPPFRHIYGRNARLSGAGDLERRNGYRTIEKGRSEVGEEIEMEKHPGGLRAGFHRLVFAIHSAGI